METTTQKIARVNFSYAMLHQGEVGGLTVEYVGGYKCFQTFDQLIDELGVDETTRLHKIAFADGMTGMWYNADNGGHVFVNGVEVN